VTIHAADDSLRQVMRLAEERDVLRLKLWALLFINFLLIAALCGLLVGVFSSSNGVPTMFDTPSFSRGAK
jgi:hypothetical protein